MSKTITLDFPVEHQGHTYDCLTMRRSKVRDRMLAQQQGKSPADVEVILFANLCGVPRGAIEELDERDYLALQDVYEGFMQPAPAKAPAGQPSDPTAQS